MNNATLIACLGVTGLFGVAWFVGEWLGQRKRRRAQRVAQQLEWRCSWCMAEMGIKPTANQTHGICQTHFMQQMIEVEKRERLHVPDVLRSEPPF